MFCLFLVLQGMGHMGAHNGQMTGPMGGHMGHMGPHGSMMQGYQGWGTPPQQQSYPGNYPRLLAALLLSISISLLPIKKNPITRSVGLWHEKKTRHDSCLVCVSGHWGPPPSSQPPVNGRLIGHFGF